MTELTENNALTVSIRENHREQGGYDVFCYSGDGTEEGSLKAWEWVAYSDDAWEKASEFLSKAALWRDCDHVYVKRFCIKCGRYNVEGDS